MLLIALLIPLSLAILVYATVLARAAIARRAVPTLEALALGAVVNFFDTFGIGSFAQTTAWMKFRKMVPDRLIPPTMIAGLTPPAMVESILFLILLGVRVDPVLLFGGAIATGVGGIVGAPLVVRARAWIVQATVAIGLVLAGIAFVLAILGAMPVGGTASSLPVGLTIAAIVLSFVLGLLANFGVGNYAPTLAILSLMGMDPHYCFPIMASGASLMGAGSSMRFIKVPDLDLRIVVGLTLGGIPAVLIAALIVKQMNVDVLRYVITIVVFYTAIVMAGSAIRGHREHRAKGVTAPLAAGVAVPPVRESAVPVGGVLMAGWVLVLLGAAGAAIALTMKTSVSSPLGEISNLSLMSAQQNYLIASGFIAVVGAILIASRRR